MIDDRPLSADRVPTLTEVVELDLPASRPPLAGDDGQSEGPEEAAVAEAPAGPVRDEAAMPEAPAPSAGPSGEAEPQAMAEDFVLAGLDEDKSVGAAPAECAQDDPAAAADQQVPATERQRPDDADAACEGAAVEMTAAAPVTEAAPGPAPEPEPEPEPEPVSESMSVPAATPVADVDAVVGQVLSELTPRIDMLLESRLREALAPALAAVADGLIRDTRGRLAVALRDLVQDAVDRALQRRADR